MESTASLHDPIPTVPFERASTVSVGEDRRTQVGRGAMKSIDDLLRDFVAQCRTLRTGNLKTFP